MEQKRTSWRTQTVSEGKQNTRKPTGWQYQWPLALVVMFAAIIGALLIGVGRGVHGEYRNVAEAFSKGMDGSGYGVAYYESGMEEHAANLCKIASKTKYADLYAEACKTVSEAIYAADNAVGVSALYDAVQQLIHAVDALNLELEEGSLDETDEEYRVAEYQNFTDQFYKARNVAVDYNEYVREYNNEVLTGFPVKVFAQLLRLPIAEEFA